MPKDMPKAGDRQTLDVPEKVRVMQHQSELIAVVRNMREKDTPVGISTTQDKTGEHYMLLHDVDADEVVAVNLGGLLAWAVSDVFKEDEPNGQ